MARDAISVVTVVKDDPSGLERTLASIEDQALLPEHIIVDGDSRSDEMIRVLHEAKRRGARVLSEPDRNCYEAMNKGWRLASSSAVAFLNAGDAYASEKSTALLAALSKGESWGYGALRIKGLGSSSIYRFDPFRRRLLALGVKYVPHPSSVVPTRLLASVGGFDETFGIAADQLLFLKLCAIAPPVVSDEVIATFATGGLSTRDPHEIAVDFRRARRATSNLVGGSEMVDAVVDKAVSTGRRAARMLSRHRD